MERTYTITLRKKTRVAPRLKKTKRAISALYAFLERHMKSDEVKLTPKLNEYIWQNGITNPVHKVKVIATKDQKGVVMARLYGEAAPVVEKKQEEPQKPQAPKPKVVIEDEPQKEKPKQQPSQEKQAKPEETKPVKTAAQKPKPAPKKQESEKSAKKQAQKAEVKK
ncbi:MAG: 50S ribosomal protein L31e [Candidatus Woesearchaeota archaeon]